MYDVFVSCATSDKDWVEGYLLHALTSAGVHCHSESQFALGVPRLQQFDEAIEQSRLIVLVLTPEYFADPINEFVDSLAQSYGLDQSTWPVIPLLLKPVTLPVRLRALQGLDATEQSRWPAIVARLCDELKRSVPQEPAIPPCPYPGMRPFLESDSNDFFGRSSEIDELLRRLRLHPFLAIIGRSGTGKSSLVRAGLVPAIRTGSIVGAAEWNIRIIRPGSAPLAELERAEDALADAAPHGRALLVIDQYEELFGEAVARGAAEQFQLKLLAWVKRPGRFLVLTVRADFYPDLMTGPLWPRIQAHRYELQPPGRDALREAIVGPAARLGVYLETSLIERLLDDAADEPGKLPLIQETLVLLWHKLQRRFLPASAYLELGGKQRTGLQVAMVMHADAALANMPDDAHRALARRVFLRLTQFGEGRADTRRQQRRSQLRSSGDDHELFEATIDRLIDARLLVAADSDGSDPPLDMAHEQLLVAWPTLHQWVSTRRGSEKIRRRLEDKASEWVRLGRGAGALLHQIELAEARAWLEQAESFDLGASTDLHALVAASADAIQTQLDIAKTAQEERVRQAERLAEEQTRRAQDREAAARKLRSSLVAAVIIGGVAALAAVLAYVFYGRAQDQATVAEEHASLARAAQYSAQARVRLGELRPITAVLLAIEAAKSTSSVTPGAETVLREALGATKGTSLPGLGTFRDVYTGTTSIDVLEGGDLAVVGSRDGTVRVWNLTDRAAPRLQATLFGPQRREIGRGLVSAPADRLKPSHVELVGLSRDGRWLVVSRTGQPLALFEISSAIRPSSFSAGVEISIAHVEMSPDRRKLATLDRSRRTVQIIDLESSPPKPSGLPYTSTQDISAISFSPNGALLVANTGNTGVLLFDVDRMDDARRVTLPLFQSVTSDRSAKTDRLAVSNDGSTLIAMSKFSTSRVQPQHVAEMWDLSKETPVLRFSFEDRKNPVAQAMIGGSDGRWLAVAHDRTVRIWDLRSQRPGVDPPSHTELAAEYVSMAFSRDGDRVAIGDYSGGVWLWELSTEARPITRLLGSEAQASVDAVAFSRDGRWLFAGHEGDDAHYWNVRDVRSGSEPLAFSPSPREPWREARIAGGGRWLVYLASGGVYLRRAVIGAAPRLVPIPLPATNVDDQKLVISADRSWVAILGADARQIYILDLSLAEPEKAVLDAEFPGKIEEASFDSRGTWLAVRLKEGGSAHVISLRHGAPLDRPLNVPGYKGGRLHLSPAGRWLAVGQESWNSKLVAATVWRLESGKEPVRHDIGEHLPPVERPVFSNNDEWLAANVDGSDTVKAKILVWPLDATSPGAPRIVTVTTAKSGVSFSPGAKWMTTFDHLGIGPKVFQLWRLPDLDRARMTRTYHTQQLFGVFSDDDTRLVVSTDLDVRAHIYRLGEQAVEGPPLTIRSGGSLGGPPFQFSKDRRWLVSSGTKEPVRLWEITKPWGVALVAQLSGRASQLSSDDRWLVVSQRDSTELVDLSLKTTTITPVKLAGGGTAQFDVERKQLRMEDGTTVRVWSLDVGELVARARTAAGRNFTWDEWIREFPGRPYEKTFPDLPVHVTTIAARLEQAESAADAEDRETANRAFSDTVSWAIEVRHPAVANTVCWSGSIRRFASVVMPACEAAVALDPSNGNLLDSRGVARVLTGDLRGALADFEYYVTWATSLGAIPATEIDQRRRWIEELRAGRAPADLPTPRR